LTGCIDHVVVAAAILALVNAMLVAALLRRFRPIQEAVLAGAALPDPSLPAPGTPIGGFVVETLDGGVLDEQRVRSGTYLIGFFASLCLKCEAERTRLFARPLDVPLLSFVYNGDFHDKALALARTLAPLGAAALLTEAVGQAFSHDPESGYPTLMRVEHGVIRAAGHSLAEIARP